MSKLNRYIAVTVSASILMVLVVLVGFNIIAAIIDEMAELDDQYTFFRALQFVMLSVPGSIFDLLPFASLIGCLAGLGSLATNSELVVVRSAGVSTGRVVWMVMKPTLVILLVGLLISETIAPVTENLAQSERATALRKTSNVVSREGLWHREGNQFMHFNAVLPNGVLYGVKIFSFDDQHRLMNSLRAERAIYQQDHWVLEDVVESELIGGQVVGHNVSSKKWQTALSPRLLNILVLDPLDLPVVGLWQYSNYLEGQGLNSGLYRLAFWKKTLQPLSTLTLVLVAIAFIFGPLREVTMGFRIFIGVLVGITFRTSQDMLAPASLVYGFQPVYASLVPIVICSLAGFWLLQRAK